MLIHRQIGLSVGYYRVNYDDNTWSLLANVLQKSHAAVHVVNRAQVSYTNTFQCLNNEHINCMVCISLMIDCR